MVSIFLGIMVATLLMSAAPVYLDALERQSINSAVESALARDGETYFTITSRSNFIPLEKREIEGTGAALDQSINASVAPLHTGTERHLRTPFYSVVIPSKPLPEPAEGFIQSYTRLNEHVTVTEGRQAQDAVLRGTHGPMVEVLVSAMTAAEFGGLGAWRRPRRCPSPGLACQGLGQDSRADRSDRP